MGTTDKPDVFKEGQLPRRGAKGQMELVILDEFAEPRSNYSIFYAMWLAAQHIEVK